MGEFMDKKLKILIEIALITTIILPAVINIFNGVTSSSNSIAAQSNDVSVKITIVSEWATGMQVDITIVNNLDMAVVDWSLKIEMSSQIYEIWGAKYRYLGNNIWLIVPINTSKFVAAGNSRTIGFSANKGGDKPYPTVVEFVYMRADGEIVPPGATIAVIPEPQPSVVVLRYPEDGNFPLAEIDVTGDGVPDYRASLNLWATGRASGTQRMYIYPGNNTVRVISGLTNVNTAWVNGYPEVYVGRKPWDQTFVYGYGVKFPIPVDKLTPFIVSFYICINDLDPTMNFNIAPEGWIVRESVMKNPGTGPSAGDIELMVWLYRQYLQPAGSPRGVETIPIMLNGKIVNEQWEVWVGDMGWTYIAFKPTSFNFTCGSVAYDPTMFIQAAKKYVPMSGLYLLDWEVGTEWGTLNNGGASARFSWIITDFKVYYGTIVTTTTTPATITITRTTTPVTTTIATTATTTTPVTTTIPTTVTTTVGSVVVRVAVVNDWGSGIQGAISITNNGNVAVTDWSLKIQMSSQIYDMWGAKYQNLGNDTWLITPVDWSRTINPGTTMSNIGFIATKKGPQFYPTIVEFTYTTVTGTPTTTPITTTTTTTPVTTPTTTRTTITTTTTTSPTTTTTSPVTTTTTTTAVPVSVRISVDSDWGTGIVVNIYISNSGSQIIRNWSLKIQMTSQITSIWNANYQYLGNNIWQITPVSWTSTIYPRSTISIGFIANKQGTQPYPTLVEFTYTT